jgi:hypothetical protein
VYFFLTSNVYLFFKENLLFFELFDLFVQNRCSFLFYNSSHQYKSSNIGKFLIFKFEFLKNKSKFDMLWMKLRTKIQ